MTSRHPLNALQVFCVVVRDGGFRQAAQTMHITPGAVSKQVRVLEEHLKEVLFDRTAGSAATLTPAGKRLYERVAREMDMIGDALNGAARINRQSTILVDTSVTLAMYWLIPQLQHFNDRHPKLRIQVRTTDGPANPAVPADVFIRRENVELRGLPSIAFMKERSVLVASPDFIAKSMPRESEDARWLAKVPRIGARSRPDLWMRWSAFHRLNPKALQAAIEYDNTILAIQAALQGLGVLVVPEVFVAGMIGAGALTMLSPARIDTGTYSYAVGRRRESARVSAFTDWLAQRGPLPETV
ncbi:LysR family transcriptional regulator [Noviherbaspirillum sp.]|uniref:LysR family transcriptional regulator n=1 Tax=Noviherbaspirillum sp. TaxID=1926288 RepID=UPI002FE0AECE